MATNLLNKILVIIVGIILITLCSSSSIYALDSVIQKGDDFLATSKDSPINEEALKSTSDYVYNILFTIAVVLAVAIGMIIGIQFITGGVAEQAKVKETLVPYIVGVFVVFASFTIWKIAVSIGNDVAPTPEGTGGTGATGVTHTYYTKSGEWYWCKNCDKELSEGEKRNRECDVSRSHKLIVKTERWYCTNCNDELSETEKRDRRCSGCSTSIH